MKNDGLNTQDWKSEILRSTLSKTSMLRLQIWPHSSGEPAWTNKKKIPPLRKETQMRRNVKNMKTSDMCKMMKMTKISQTGGKNIAELFWVFGM